MCLNEIEITSRDAGRKFWSTINLGGDKVRILTHKVNSAFATLDFVAVFLTCFDDSLNLITLSQLNSTIYKKPKKIKDVAKVLNKIFSLFKASLIKKEMKSLEKVERSF